MTPSLSMGLEPAASSALLCDHQPPGDSFVTTGSFLTAPGGHMVALGAVQSPPSCSRRITGGWQHRGAQCYQPPQELPLPPLLQFHCKILKSLSAWLVRAGGKLLQGAAAQKKGCRTPLVQSQPFLPLHTAAMSLPALVQNGAINPIRAKFCREKLPEPTGSGPFPPQGALTSVKAALM